MHFLTELSTLWGQSQARHAMLVHTPIVISMLCVIAAIASAARAGKVASLRWTALVLTAVLTVSAFVTSQSGESAKSAVEGALSPEGQNALHEHEELGEKVWLFAAAGCVLLALGFIKDRPALNERRTRGGNQVEADTRSNPPRGEIPVQRDRRYFVRLGSTWLAAALSVWTAGWVADTAHHGGKLVYEYGAVTATKAFVPTIEGGDDRGDPRVAHFREKVYPILKGVCMKCHNPQGMAVAGKLDQTAVANLLRGGRSGRAVVPGRPDESLMIKALSWRDESLQMPPVGRLSDEQIAAIREWITDGAVWAPPTAPDAD